MPVETLVRSAEGADGAAINAAFNEVFGTRRALGEWVWKFLGRGQSLRAAVAVDAGGRVIAHYGALPVAFIVDGHQITAGQIVDVYVASAGREGLAAARLFRKVIGAFVGAFCGADDISLTYGFPGPRHARLVELGAGALGSDEMRPFPVRLWRRSPQPKGKFWTRHSVCSGPDAARLDELWSRAGRRYPVAMARDARWAAWRLARPGAGSYEELWALRRGRAAAWAVLKSTLGRAQVVDLLWDGEHAGALAALDRVIRTRACAVGADAAEMWLEGDRQAETVLARLGWAAGANPLGVACMAYGFHPGFSASSLDGRLYVTLADSDLV